MAYFGLSNPYIAKYLSDGNYTEGFKCGNAVSTSVTPAYNEGSVFGDNKQTEYLKEFKNAAVEAGVTSLPLIANQSFLVMKSTEMKKFRTQKTLLIMLDTDLSRMK